MSIFNKVHGQYGKIVFIVFFLIFFISNITMAFEWLTDDDSKLNKSTKLVGDPGLEKYPFKLSDGLYISTLPDTASFLNGVFAIDDRGYVEFPIVGKVNVSKMTKDQLVEFLRENFKSYLRYPNIYLKPVVRVSLLGGFARPGLYYVDINSSLWDVVHLAGGTLLEDGIYDMKWERDHDENVDDLTPLFEQGMSLKKMGFKSGDQIRTPSPTARTVWDTIGDVMPILTFAVTTWMLYYTYQRDMTMLQRR